MKYNYLYILFFFFLFTISFYNSLPIKKTDTISLSKRKKVNKLPIDEETTSVEFTLPEIQVDKSHNIDFYYPYFYKTHIIEYQDSINYKELTNNCLDLGCQWCDTTSKLVCSECHHGFFLYEGKCYTSCPNNYIADIFKKTCNVMTNTTFSFGSCKNICGLKSIDCSCEQSCRSQGNCCSDYQDCESIVISNQNKNCTGAVPHCSMAGHLTEGGKPQCGQCESNYYLRNGECVQNCFPSDKIIQSNRICIKNQDCRVENCAECIDNNPAVCKKCYNGFFMSNNQCLESCPRSFRADRISWACLETPVFAWYWVFPSRTTCSRRCGMVMSQDVDCSCSDDCFRYGNCCQDIEDYCPDMIFWNI